MPTYLQRKALEALRSTDKPQTQLSLVEKTPDGRLCFCALGLMVTELGLAEVEIDPVTRAPILVHPQTREWIDSADAAALLGLDVAQAHAVTQWNDTHRFPFPTIAAELEELLVLDHDMQEVR